MNSEAVLATSGLSRDFGIKRALDKVDLEVGPARIVALLGPNGAGKTTLMKLLSGGLEPAEGSSSLFGEPSRHMSSKTLQRFSVMLDGEGPPGWANLKLLLDLEAEVKPQFDRARCEQLLCLHDLSLKSRYGSLSKGQKRWVLAMLCLCSGSELLLLDEPAEGLDPAARRELYDRVRTYANDRSATLIVATHLIHDIERIADEVAILCQGKLMLYEDLETLREEIRCVEISGSIEQDWIPDGWEWLTRNESAEGITGWIRCENEWIRSSVDEMTSSVVLHPFALEEFYLALTERNSRIPITSLKIEVQP